MKQFQFEYTNEDSFSRNLTAFKEKCDVEGISVGMFQVFTEVLDWNIIHRVCGIIEETFPEAPYMGCSTS